MQENIYDIAIIGGGINGVATARDAAGRGLKTFLCDKGDLGSATSAFSSKLIHGGLRYLEFYEFSMVRKSLKERDVIAEIAPNLVKEQRFIMPYNSHMRPAWLMRLGLFMYDHLHLAKHFKKSAKVQLNTDLFRESFNTGFIYSDAMTDDHRLVIATALDAQERGSHIHTYLECEKAETVNGVWELTLKNESGELFKIHAKTLVNATGPWAQKFIEQGLNAESSRELRLVKGSHIVTEKLFEGRDGYTFQDEKGRIVFCLPYEDKTLIGTTEEAFNGNPADAKISAEETDYLLSVCNTYFKQEISEKDIVWTFSGVRPLIEEKGKDARRTSRDYFIEFKNEKAPTIHIWGGKLTTHRLLAEDVLQKLKKHLPKTKKWTGKTKLYNTNFIYKIMTSLQEKYAFLPEELLTHYAKLYGNGAFKLLQNVTHQSALGAHYGGNLYEREAIYLIQHEWAKTAESILWFRTKHGLSMKPLEIDFFKKEFNFLVAKAEHEKNIQQVQAQAQVQSMR